MYPESEYLLAVGKAYYAFAYYERIIAYAIDYLGKLKDSNSCFLDGEPKPRLEGDKIAKRLRADVEALLSGPLRDRALEVHGKYDHLRKRRNYLLHAHPLTDDKGKQRLGHREELHWTLDKLSTFTAQVEAASRVADAVSHDFKTLLKSPPPTAP